MSPDPSSLHFSSLANPQTFNLYAYVTNDPLKYIDIHGLYSCGDCGDDGEYLDGEDDYDFGGGGGGGGWDDGGTTVTPAPDPDPCPVATCVSVTADPDPPPDPTPSEPIFYNPALPDPSDPSDPANQTVQQKEQAAEQQAKLNIAGYASNTPKLNPGDNISKITLTPSCDAGNHDCTYTLSGMANNPYTGSPNEYHVWEHQTQQIKGSSSVGTQDWITPGIGVPTEANQFSDTLTSGIDSYRFFTISTSPVYDSSNQIPVNIQEGGQIIGYEHIYANGGPVYINGSSQLP